MPVDEALLERYRRFRDERTGIEEEFLQPVLGGARTVAILSRPLGPARRTGWVVCHSFGIEQVTLHRLEVVTARALAAAGFPVLRFHVQGYGDSERRGTVVEASWHLDAAMDAVAFMRAVEGVEAVGMVGVRFGALVAALSAERADLVALALWHPFLTGTQFLREFATTAMFERMLDRAERGERGPGAFDEGFGPEGWKDLNGFRLGRRALEEISAIDLRRDLTSYGGSVLVGAITRSGALPREAAAVAEYLRNLGSRCEESAVRDESAPMLGQHQFKKIGNGEVERDLFAQAYRSVGATTSTWASSLATDLGPAGPGA
jgi:pimeloyl-ACP methyl ester carboxylesterase